MSVSRLAVILSLCLVLSLPVLQADAATGFVPHQGDHFSYYEVENLGNGVGSYVGYSEHTAINGTEQVDGVSGNGTVSAYYSYSWTWVNSSGSTETGRKSGSYTFSSKTLLYLNGTDDQTGYINPTVWFAMNDSIPENGAFSLLNTQMTVMSRNYSYYLPSQGRSVAAIFAQGTSSYLRNDQYGQFAAEYTWSTCFDPSTGYIIGYSYVEHDSNSSTGAGFNYTDDLYVTSTSYPLTAAAAAGNTTTLTTVAQNTSTGSASLINPGGPAKGSTQYVGYIAVIVMAVLIVAVLIYALSRRKRRPALPRHPPEPEPRVIPGRDQSATPPSREIHLTPPPVQQVVIREVVKVNCKYCGTLIDSTATTCPKCGAPRT
jgi:hypothetical protein